MNINEASDFFESLIPETGKKSELRVYEHFVGILSDLKSKNLTKEQLQSIEEALDSLELKATPKNKKRFFNKKLAEFKKHLKDKFSFITEGYYTAIGMSLGMSFGVVFGTLFDKIFGVSMGIAFGMIIGLIVGRIRDSEVEKQNRVLKAKLT